MDVKKALLDFATKQMPPISPTEQVALEGVSLENVPPLNQTLHGKPDWKGLYALGLPKLSDDAQEFLDTKTREFCESVDIAQIEEDNDLSEGNWKYLADNKFFGMVIKKKWGGLGLGELDHSAVVKMVATRNPAAAVTVMVPNSLGPGKLLQDYGTEEQKEKFLPKLATGDYLPCFALTSPKNGSDAANPDTKGTLFEKEDGSFAIRIKGDKRYITLAPRANLPGVAFSLEIAPELQEKLIAQGQGHIVEQVKKIPTTVALEERGAPGLTMGRRHEPGSPFLNGPIVFDDVEISVDQIIGGFDQAGKGWKMLMECLGVGRAISLPTVSAGGAELCTMATSAYSMARQQFGMPIGKFDGVKTVLGEMAGLTYLIESARVVGAQMVDAGHNTTTLSAMTKSETTEMERLVVDHAMDIFGGAAIQEGPQNIIKPYYKAVPVGITVEGANLVTKNLAVFGQGATMNHKHVRPMMEAIANKDKDALWNVGTDVAKDLAKKVAKSAWMSATDGRGSDMGGADVAPEVKRLHQQVNRLSASFAVAADASMYHLGGALKRKEDVSRRLGQSWTMLNFAAMSLKHWDDQGRNKEDLPLVNWAVKHCLHEAEEQLVDLFDNYPTNKLKFFREGVKGVLANPKKAAVEFLVVSFLKSAKWGVETAAHVGGHYKKPDDDVTHKVAELITTDSSTRQRLFKDVFVSKNSNDPVKKLEFAFKFFSAPFYQDMERKARKHPEAMDQREKKLLEQINELRNDIVAVDSFESKYSAPQM